MGCGLKLPLGNGVYFTTYLLINLELRKIDKKFNNDYEEHTLPSTTGYTTIIESGNYFGLNSNAKNINTALTLGISVDI